MVIEIAKVFIPLSTQYEINIFPVSEIHNPPPSVQLGNANSYRKYIKQQTNRPLFH